MARRKYTEIGKDYKQIRKVEETNLSEAQHANTENKHDDVGFVLDASICGIENLKDILSSIFAKNAKIILTSITIKELKKLQEFKDIAAKDAKYILTIAAENYENFRKVLIDETFESPDECIIKYCADHKQDIVLLTADKMMALNARILGVKTQYYKHNNNSRYSKVQATTYAVTLLAARTIGDKLVVCDFENNYRSVLIISNGIEYTKGEYELKIGDDVYIATNKTQYMTFAHYQIISLTPKNNCKLVYSRRIYSASEIDCLTKAGYKSFMRDFKRRHGL